jgi:chromatin remodeling complex protein RSC6
MFRNRWSQCSGIGGNNKAEWVVTLLRNTHLGTTELPRTEITKKLWDYIKANKLQTRTENGKPMNAGKFIVADVSLLPIFKNTKSKSKSGKVTNLTNLQEGQTIDMMQMAAVVGANIE